jgi:membrane protein
LPAVRSQRPATREVSPREAVENLSLVLTARRTLRLLLRKLSQERVLMRASALAFDSLLAIVPFMAVSMGSVGLLGGRETLRDLLRELAYYYVPRAAGEAFDHSLDLAASLDFHAIGLFGLLALVPVVFALVDSVEHALADMFGMPRRTHWFRLLLLGALLSLAPLGSVLSVRYVPLASLALHQWLTPFGLLFFLLYAVFRRMPRLRISRRAAAVGALSAALILATAKLGFGVYAQLAVSLHALWGAVAFVPLFLVWILLCWYAVLSAAAVACVTHAELAVREAGEPKRSERPRRRRSRLRQRLAARPSQRAPGT